MKEHLKHYVEFSKTPHVRGLRILLEYFYALEIFQPILDSGIRIVSVFGSARLGPETSEYKDAKKLGSLLYKNGYAVVTGASQGIMQAANEGVAEGILADLAKKNPKVKPFELKKNPEYYNLLKKFSVGLKISLPFEPHNNPFVGVNATFHYFMVRKFFFGTLSSAFIACEGGWGTRDELFEILTLVQTGKAPLMPVIYISPDPRHLTQDIDFAIRKKYISPEDRYLIDIVKTPEEALDIITRFHRVVKTISYDKQKAVEVVFSNPISKPKVEKVRKLITQKYNNIFEEGVEITSSQMILRGFNYKSYGYLRQIIDALSV